MRNHSSIASLTGELQLPFNPIICSGTITLDLLPDCTVKKYLLSFGGGFPVVPISGILPATVIYNHAISVIL